LFSGHFLAISKGDGGQHKREAYDQFVFTQHIVFSGNLGNLIDTRSTL